MEWLTYAGPTRPLVRIRMGLWSSAVGLALGGLAIATALLGLLLGRLGVDAALADAVVMGSWPLFSGYLIDAAVQTVRRARQGR